MTELRAGKIINWDDNNPGIVQIPQHLYMSDSHAYITGKERYHPIWNKENFFCVSNIFVAVVK